jgi:SAM-dependent methyltransferase
VTQPPESGASLFDAYYYAHDCGTPYERNDAWLGFFDRVAEWIARTIGPDTVLDAGCAYGFLVERLRARGIDAHGIDVSEYALAQVDPAVRPFCQVGSVTQPFGRRFDLIVCQEVVEHLPAHEAAQAIANLAAHSDDVLFSSTPEDYREVTHFTVQSPDRWAAWFAEHGLFRDVDYDADFLTPWAMRFRRLRAPVNTVVAAYERALWRRDQERHARRAVALELRQELVSREDNEARLRHERDIAVEQLENLRAYVAEQEARVRELYQEATWRRDQALALQTWHDEVVASPAWRLTQGLHGTRAHLAPPGSRRERSLERVFAATRLRAAQPTAGPPDDGAAAP